MSLEPGAEGCFDARTSVFFLGGKGTWCVFCLVGRFLCRNCLVGFVSFDDLLVEGLLVTLFGVLGFIQRPFTWGVI